MRSDFIKYSDLIHEKDGAFMAYVEKLKTIEWLNRREEILKRDDWTCKKCNARYSKMINGEAYINYTKEEEEEFMQKVREGVMDFQKMLGLNLPLQKIRRPLDKDYQPKYLHVHHTYYIKNTLPWNYPDESLISLCVSCHQNVHENDIVPVYADNLKQVVLNIKRCSRCKGTGYLKEYNYYMGGVCFKCNGNEFEEDF